MKKVILIGNGFTLNLISRYKNESMMEAFNQKVPDLVHRIEVEFEYFRNSKFSDSKLYNVTEALFASNNLYGGYDGIHIENNAQNWIIERLNDLGYHSPNQTFNEYFKNYGLIYFIKGGKISGIEAYLKVVALFEEIGRFTKDEYTHIKQVANEIYFNKGNHGKDSITNKEIDLVKLDEFLIEFEDVYTTNYDTILDDFLEVHNRFPYHLHGGFSINHRNKDPDGRYRPTEARLIWGINGEEKFSELSVGWDFRDINFRVARFGQSRWADYFDFLKEREYDEIYILGFSGENDDHINQRIKDNQTIKNIVVYVNPEKVFDKETQVISRIIFGGNNKQVNLRSWDEFWKSIK